MKRIGPHVFTPASMLVCTGCDYLKQKLIRSGRDPQWECLCMHPKAKEAAQKVTPHERVWPTIGDIGCWIGEEPTTPEWCPETKDNKQENPTNDPFQHPD